MSGDTATTWELDERTLARIKAAKRGVNDASRKFAEGVLAGVNTLGGVQEYWLGFATSSDPKERLAALKVAAQVGILDDAVQGGAGPATIVINTLNVMPAKPDRGYFGDDAQTPDVIERIQDSFVAVARHEADTGFDPESII